jgi:hypothetical protein
MFDDNFINACLYGDADLEDLDTYVEYWHTHETGSSLREFLGMTEYEYETWVSREDFIIRDILRAHMDNVPFENYQDMSPEDRIAARSWDIDKIERLKNDDKRRNQ